MIRGHGDDAYQYDEIRIDFSSNISAHTSKGALMAHLSAMTELLDHYPEPEAWTLETMIAEKHGIEPGQVVVTSGATEAIYLIAQTFRMVHDIPVPTFSEYEDACKMFPTEDHSQRMLWLCNPNNPTGKVYDEEYIERMTKDYDMVVIDQSYECYTDKRIMTPREAMLHGGLIQIHSMTKTYGVPGLRLGYITAPSDITEAVRKNMRPWSVSALAVEAGKYLLQHDEMRCVPDLQEAQRLSRMLRDIVHVEDSSTNFMLCKLDVGTATALKEFLVRKYGMLIRDASNFRGLTERHSRIAAQRAEENDALVEGIKEYLSLCTR